MSELLEPLLSHVPSFVAVLFLSVFLLWKIFSRDKELAGRIDRLFEFIEERLSSIEDSLKEQEREFRKELDRVRNELTKKVDIQTYYNDISGWRQDFRELRNLIVSVFRRGGKPDES